MIRTGGNDGDAWEDYRVCDEYLFGLVWYDDCGDDVGGVDFY